MFCPNCGKENSNESRFCDSCGSILKENHTQQPNVVVKTKSGGKVGLIIGIIAIIVILGGGILAAIAIPAYNGYIQSSKEKVAKNTAGTVAAYVAAFYSEYQRVPSYYEIDITTPEGFLYEVRYDDIIVYGDGSPGYTEDDFEPQTVDWRY